MDTVQFLADLRAQRDRINDAITALEALNGNAVTPAKSAVKAAKPAEVKSTKSAPVASTASTKRMISPEARQRMAEAQQKRWAKKKRAVKVAAKKAAAPAVAAAVKEATKA